jgi:hypothetical protein
MAVRCKASSDGVLGHELWKAFNREHLLRGGHSVSTGCRAAAAGCAQLRLTSTAATTALVYDTANGSRVSET